MWSQKLRRFDAVEHRIDLAKVSRPFRSIFCRPRPKIRELEELVIWKQLKADVIEPATCEWASSVLLFWKKDGSFWFCIDYRRLNEATI